MSECVLHILDLKFVRVSVSCLSVCCTYWIASFCVRVRLRKVCRVGSEEWSPCWFSGVCAFMLCLWVTCLMVLSGVSVLGAEGVCVCSF